METFKNYRKKVTELKQGTKGGCGFSITLISFENPKKSYGTENLTRRHFQKKSHSVKKIERVSSGFVCYAKKGRIIMVQFPGLNGTIFVPTVLYNFVELCRTIFVNSYRLRKKPPL